MASDRPIEVFSSTPRLRDLPPGRRVVRVARSATMHAREALFRTAYAAGFVLWRRLASDRRLKRPVFLVGCPRSGTSLTLTLMMHHPELAVMAVEAHELWDPHHYRDPQADH